MNEAESCLKRVHFIAGCYSERIPVLHLVGVPHISLQDKHALLQ